MAPILRDCLIIDIYLFIVKREVFWHVLIVKNGAPMISSIHVIILVFLRIMNNDTMISPIVIFSTKGLELTIHQEWQHHKLYHKIIIIKLLKMFVII
ncbi:hypothetical protein Mgra_00007876 [Meloidogyne graminicola]|uniref:Uncharacterized protein n=1 Tax=Meloidogyne graminicola TaxID=189291 RepID=A0A8S9ZHF5_9BILA|nr:hypothetical protein Mgra_00007876 [Meloidogyne graminicola]